MAMTPLYSVFISPYVYIFSQSEAREKTTELLYCAGMLNISEQTTVFHQSVEAGRHIYSSVNWVTPGKQSAVAYVQWQAKNYTTFEMMLMPPSGVIPSMKLWI